MQTKDSELGMSWRLLNPILFSWRFLYCECFFIFFLLEISPELPTSPLLPTCSIASLSILFLVSSCPPQTTPQAHNPSPSSLKHAFNKKSGICFIYLFLVVLDLCCCTQSGGQAQKSWHTDLVVSHGYVGPSQARD